MPPTSASASSDRATVAPCAVHEAANAAASPFRFEVDGMELHREMTPSRTAVSELGAIYHSHRRAPRPYPSQTDVNFAAGCGRAWSGSSSAWPGRTASRRCAAYRIDDGRIDEVPSRSSADG
jgi:proteasome lid subunit RPN8/RPN11